VLDNIVIYNWNLNPPTRPSTVPSYVVNDMLSLVDIVDKKICNFLVIKLW